MSFLLLFLLLLLESLGLSVVLESFSDRMSLLLLGCDSLVEAEAIVEELIAADLGKRFERDESWSGW